MQRVDGRWIYSTTDINDFLECRRLPELERLVALEHLARPERDDDQAELIVTKGEAHEAAHLARLQRIYDGDVVALARPAPNIAAYREAESRTLAAMRAGRAVIYQATFFDGTFIGRADFLQRVESPSGLGAWSYEAVDTKLALSTKPTYIVQLCGYSEHLARLQGRMPERGSIVFGDGKKLGFTLHEYLAYYRRVKAQFLAFMTSADERSDAAPATYPLACEHCSFCAWNDACRAKRVADDHLSLVAWMRRDQTAKLEGHDITTVAELAHAPDDRRPPVMPERSFAKLRRQAQLQVESRTTASPIYELLAHDPRAGFGLLPAPAPGDVYFDMEGDPLYEPRGGLEYLFGCWLPDDEVKFRSFWGRDRVEEKHAFEAFIDFIVERRRTYPGLHVYHYANYEKAALCRLSQTHGTRGEALDDLLRAEVFVDLYAVVRQALMIGEDSYSIKRLERFYGLTRATEVKKGDQSIVMFERWRLSGDQRILDDIEAYNRDDCESTHLLHRWLVARRSEAIAAFGSDIPWRVAPSADEPCHDPPFDGCTECVKREKERRENERRSAIEQRLLASVLAPESEDAYEAMSEDARTRYLLGCLLSYHRREAYPVWWELFRRYDEVDTLQEQDATAIAGLEFASDIPPYPQAKSVVYSYRFPEQRHKMDRGGAHDPLARAYAGEILEVDDDLRVLRLKRTDDIEAARAITALVPPGPIRTVALEDAVLAIAEAFERGTLDREYPAAADMLRLRRPRTVTSRATLQPDDVTAAAVSSIVADLDASYVFIQGPPGSGKSTVGSHVIADLLQAGKRVGIMSNGHKAVHHLMGKVERVMRERGAAFRGLYKHSSDASRYVSAFDDAAIASVGTNKPFERDDYQLAGGTAWLFARGELRERFDYLFIDEAGQIALANALAASLGARNVVLLGDPSQLAHVTSGTHALHASDSILAHLLGRDATIPPDRGIFLDHSFRMHPEICTFISESMYDARLKPGEFTHLHRVTSASLSGAGLRYIPVAHDDNSAASLEEAERIVAEIAELRRGTVVNDRHGIERPLRDDDIIVVTPYNAQRRLIARKLRDAGFDVPVGTVDKFQGQEAAVVFYSMATSSGATMPRDVRFLFEANRFNVAISRARAMSVLVCSPRLLDLPCRTPEEMALVNVLCDYVERCAR